MNHEQETQAPAPAEEKRPVPQAQVKGIAAWLARFVAQPDKALHVMAGLLLVFLLCSAGVAPMWALAACSGVAWAKERWDKSRPKVHTWDGWDGFATVIGGQLGAAAWVTIAPSWAVG